MKPHPTDDLVTSMARVRDDSLAGFAERPAARDLLAEVTALPYRDDSHRVNRHRSSRPKMRTRLMAAGALAAAIAAAATVAHDLGGTDGRGNPPPIPAVPAANVAEVLDRAATAAETPPLTAPRPDQWIFTEHKQRFPAIGTRVNTPRTRLVNFTERTWWRADGRQEASTQQGYYGDGKLRIENGVAGWKHHYPTLATLPTAPDALRAAVESKEYEGATADKGTAEQQASFLYDAYSAILRNGVAPPKVEAAIFRAIKTIPGVTVNKNALDVAGRPAIAVARVAEGYLDKEILLDRRTYRYMGERLIAIKDHTDTATDGTVVVQKGAIVNLETRTAWSIVDKPGRLP